jgi:hypothetical protein
MIRDLSKHLSKGMSRIGQGGYKITFYMRFNLQKGKERAKLSKRPDPRVVELLMSLASL